MDIIISPEKNLYINPESSFSINKKFIKEFNTNYLKGLLSLLNQPELRKKSYSYSYWFDYSSEIIKNFCISTNSSNISTAANNNTINSYLQRSSAISGQEYLDYKLLENIWSKATSYLNDCLHNFSGDLKEFIEKNYPNWAQVGLLNFHLAETPVSVEKPFAFIATYTTRVSDKLRLQHSPLGKVVADYIQKEKIEVLQELLKPIVQAGEQSDFISKLTKEKRIYKTCLFSNIEALEFLKSVPCCEKSGIVVKLPKDWQNTTPTCAKVTVQIGDDNKTSFVGFNSLFKFKAYVTIGSKKLSPKEVDDLLKQQQSLVQIKGKWVEVNSEKLKILLDRWQQTSLLQKEGFTFAEALRMISKSSITKSTIKDKEQEILEDLTEFTPGNQIKDILKSISNPRSIVLEHIQEILSTDLKATLRPYQQEGVKWLSFISQHSLGGCLADDMGLGKTIQIISLLLIEKRLHPNSSSLLIVPASLLGNWENEIKKFAPSLRAKILHRSLMSAVQIQNTQHDNNLDLVITTYALSKRITWLKEKTWNVFILDEAQAIKNPSSQQSQSIKKIKSRVRFTMTGTPIENSVSDLWSLFDFNCHSLLGNYTEFKSFYKRLQESGSYEPLKKLVGPYILRRKKTDKSVISDLPDKTELQTYCQLSTKQIKLYQETLQKLKSDLKANLDSADIKRKGIILGYLLKFKQICNHPSQFLSDNIYEHKDSGKLLRLREIAETISSRGEKVLIFTQFREITDILANFLSEIFCLVFIFSTL